MQLTIGFKINGQGVHRLRDKGMSSSMYVISGVSYKSLIWTNLYAVCLAVAIANFIVLTARRYVGLTLFLDKRTSDYQFQKQIISQLKYLNETLRTRYDLLYYDKPNTLDSAMLFLQDIYNEAYDVEIFYSFKRSIFREKKSYEKAYDIFKKYLWSVITLMMIAFSVPVIIQNGFDGLNFLLQDAPADLNLVSKLSISSPSGFATSIFNYVSIINLFDMIENCVLGLIDQPESLPHAMWVMAMTIVANIGLYLVAKDVTDNPDNLFAFQPKTITSKLVTYATPLTSGLAGVSNVEQEIVKDRAPSETSCMSLIKLLERNSLPKEKVATLRKMGFFEPKKKEIIAAIESKRSIVRIHY